MTRVVLNRRLALETRLRSSDGAGGFEETWSQLGELWAQVKPRSGRYANATDGALSVTGFRITVRAAPVGQTNRPEPGQRFRMGSRYFRIEAVTEHEPTGLYLQCQCEEEMFA
ncbi:head-tail adaptor protein [Cognatishimia sp. F0-27]|uniref:head-tail adaptor protein n=1 Tax=Cognatishimia sp. F0-27 TaxID=2816855 RepID=UPI001D0CA693|nr:head-tail adaptor protein [Cognatishimia sp. F0-27]MCC1493421.1 head-tail adaptor protein [Cognatishimia sp. F0-27]